MTALLLLALACAAPTDPVERFRDHFQRSVAWPPSFDSQALPDGAGTHTLRYDRVLRVELRTCTAEDGAVLVRGMTTGADGLPLDAEKLAALEDAMQAFLDELPASHRATSQEPACVPGDP